MDNVIKAVLTLVFVTLISMGGFMFVFRGGAQPGAFPIRPLYAQTAQPTPSNSLTLRPTPPRESRAGRGLSALNGVQFGSGWRPGMGRGMGMEMRMGMGMMARYDDRWDPPYTRGDTRYNDENMPGGRDVCAGDLGGGNSYLPDLLPDDGGSAIAPEDVSFAADIQPILNANCVACHGGSAGLFLDSYDNVIQGGVNGPVIAPGDPSGSKLIQFVSSGYMPLNGRPLSPSQVETIANWVATGAPDN